MRLLVSWLREFVDVPVDPPALASTLSLAGFEVASIEPPPAGVARPGAGPAAGQDAVIDFEITANRPDCLSVIGLARETAAAFDRPLRGPSGADAAGGTGPAVLDAGLSSATPDLGVTIEAPDLCPRYAAAVVDVRVGPSPAWLAARLEAAGVRPINNIVDVTNYVLIETGHPLHAFDLARLDGRELRIRRARAGERLTTLDGADRALDPEMLVIADRSRPQAIGGVMGGAGSEVMLSTRAVALESAWFRPPSVRRTSKRLGLKTEASIRFERGADIGAPVTALRRAMALIEAIGAGTARGPVVDCRSEPHRPLAVRLRRERIARLLGLAVDDSVVERILAGLGFTVTAAADGWDAGVPSWRIDVTREVDLVEEVARHHGYDQVPATFPVLDRVPAAPDPRVDRARLLRRVLASAGFSEAITFSFVERPAAASFADGAGLVDIAYPLSEKFATLRPSLLPGLVEALAQNRRRQTADVRLAEVGACFTAERGEHARVAFAWTGAASAPHWSGSSRRVDFFDAKGVVERLCQALRVTPRFVASERPFLVPGRAAEVRSGDTPLGVVGQLRPGIGDTYDLPASDEVFVAEIELDRIAAVADEREIRYTPLPRHPSVVRDLSVLVPGGLAAEAVRTTVRAAGPPTLAAVVEFDRYRGKGIAEGLVSLSLRLTFRSADRTLTDGEVQQAMDTIVAALAREHGAVQR